MKDISEDVENIERAEGRFMTGPMKALQIIQTLMLLLSLGIGTWVGTTTVESVKCIARMEETIRGMGSESSRLSSQLQRLSDEHYALDRRVTTIEARGFKQ